MALPMVTAAVALFYFGAIPIHIAVCLQLGANAGFGFGVSPFEPRFALQRARHQQSAGGKLPPFWKKISLRDALPGALRALRYAAAHVRIERVRLDGTFASDDAALTALVCGGATALGSALRCALSREVRFSLRPDFSGGPLRAELSGMISMRVGHIMLAALLGALQYGSRRLKEWTSIPLKAS